MFDAHDGGNPVTSSEAESIALATRPSCLWLYFLSCVLEDGGAAFVNELANRRSSFGSLTIDDYALNKDNFRRLLDVGSGIIDHLELPLSADRLGLLPLFAKVESLKFWIFSSSALDVNCSL